MEPKVVSVLHDAFRKAMDDPQVQSMLEKADMPPMHMSTDEYTRFARQAWVAIARLWVTPAAMSAQLAAQCLPDPIEPVFVAGMALFLASDDSAMCTAGNYMVDAGSI